MGMLLDIVSAIFVIAGSFFVLVGALGFIRMPDVYTRMHAASVIDTLGASLLIVGMLLQAPNFLVAFKLVVIAALFFFFGPVASHAIAKAALAAGVSPILSADRRERGRDDEPAAARDAADGSGKGGAA